MRRVLLTVFVLLLNSCCSSGIETDQTGHKTQTKHSGKVSQKLIGLNFDVLYTILHQLELNELFNAAEAVPEFSDITKAVLRRKYLKNEPSIKCIIEDRFDSDLTERKLDFVDNKIDIHGYRDCMNMLENFGHTLQSVIIEYGRKTDNSTAKIINRSLDQYCSESLKRLQLDYWSEIVYDAMEGFTRPFSGVEEFTVDMPDVERKTPKPLTELFPNLRRLDLTCPTYAKATFIEEHFPHLKDFHLKIPSHGRSHAMESYQPIKEMIRRNNAIQSIEFDFEYPDNFLQFLSETTPNLESLKIQCLKILDSIQFEKLKKLHINIGTNSMKYLEKLSLPNLQSLTTTFWPSREDDLRQFFTRHTQLKQLRFVNFIYTLPQLPRLNVWAPNAVDLSIDFRGRYDGVEVITHFLQNNQQLENVCFEYPYVWENAQAHIQILQERFRNEWTISGKVRREGIGTYYAKEIQIFLFERTHRIQE